MNTQALSRQFAAELERLPRSADSAARRAAAFEAFSAKGFPTRRDEQWRYTDLKPISTAELDFAPAPPSAEIISRVAESLEQAGFANAGLGVTEADAARLNAVRHGPAGHIAARLDTAALDAAALDAPRQDAPGLGATEADAAGRNTARLDAAEQDAAKLDAARHDVAASRLVFIDGGYCDALSRIESGDGLRVASLASCSEADLPTHAHARRDGHPLAALNAAFAREGALISAADGARTPAPIELIFVASGRSGIAAQPRVIIDLGQDADVTVIQHLLDLESAGGWFNAVTEIVQAPGSQLTLHRLQDHGTQQFHTALMRAELAEDAKFNCGYYDLGGRLVRNDFDVRLAGPGAEADLNGLFLASSGQHTDNHICMDHIAPRTRSGESFRGIIGDRGHGVFNGKVVVHRDAQHIDARQSSDNLLLADNAEIDTKPELEIYADDVKCSHGATIGELDDEQLFYLRARGLADDEARKLLTFAFANTILERIALPQLRERIAARVAVRLPKLASKNVTR